MLKALLLFFSINSAMAQLLDQETYSYEGKNKIIYSGVYKGKLQKVASLFFEYDKIQKEVSIYDYDVLKGAEKEGYLELPLKKLLSDHPEHKKISITLSKLSKRQFLEEFIAIIGDDLETYKNLTTKDFDILFLERNKKHLESLTDDQLYQKMTTTIQATPLYKHFHNSTKYKMCEFAIGLDEFDGGTKVELDFCKGK